VSPADEPATTAAWRAADPLAAFSCRLGGAMMVALLRPRES